MGEGYSALGGLGRAHMALCISWTAWYLFLGSHWHCWEQVPAKLNPEAGWVCGHPPFLWMPPSHAVPLLLGHQPLFFRSCSYRGLDAKTQPFSPFPRAKAAGALGQCASPSGPPGPTEKPGTPQTCQAVSSSYSARRGWQGLSPRDGKW